MPSNKPKPDVKSDLKRTSQKGRRKSSVTNYIAKNILQVGGQKRMKSEGDPASADSKDLITITSTNGLPSDSATDLQKKEFLRKQRELKRLNQGPPGSPKRKLAQREEEGSTPRDSSSKRQQTEHLSTEEQLMDEISCGQLNDMDIDDDADDEQSVCDVRTTPTPFDHGYVEPSFNENESPLYPDEVFTKVVNNKELKELRRLQKLQEKERKRKMAEDLIQFDKDKSMEITPMKYVVTATITSTKKTEQATPTNTATAATAEAAQLSGTEKTTMMEAPAPTATTSGHMEDQTAPAEEVKSLTAEMVKTPPAKTTTAARQEEAKTPAPATRSSLQQLHDATQGVPLPATTELNARIKAKAEELRNARTSPPSGHSTPLKQAVHFQERTDEAYQKRRASTSLLTHPEFRKREKERAGTNTSAISSISDGPDDIAAVMREHEINVPYRAQHVPTTARMGNNRQASRKTVPNPAQQDAVFYVPPFWVNMNVEQVKAEIRKICITTNPESGLLYYEAITVNMCKAPAPPGKSSIRIVAKLPKAARFLRGTFHDKERKKSFAFEETRQTEEAYGEKVEVRGVHVKPDSNQILRDNNDVIRVYTFGKNRPTRNPKWGFDVTLRVAPGTQMVTIGGRQYSTGVHVERAPPAPTQRATTNNAWTCAKCQEKDLPHNHRYGDSLRCVTWQCDVERRRRANQEQRDVEIATAASQEAALKIANQEAVAAALNKPKKYVRGLSNDEFTIITHAQETARMPAEATPLPETETALVHTLGVTAAIKKKIGLRHARLAPPRLEALNKYTKKLQDKLRALRRANREALDETRHAHEKTLAVPVVPVAGPSRGGGVITPSKQQLEEKLKQLIMVIRSDASDSTKYLSALSHFLETEFSVYVREVENAGRLQ